MTKNTYIDSAHILVTGGEITDENSVWREDIAALLPAAVNFALVGGLFEQMNAENDRDIPSAFVVPFEDLEVDKTGDRPFINYPTITIPLQSNRDIRMVTTQCGGSNYTIMDDNMFKAWSYYKDILLDERFFKPIGKKIYLYNMPDIEEKVNVYLIQSAEAYAGSDHMPVPAGKEMQVVESLAQMFLKQRSVHTDKIIDKTDIN